MNAPDYNPLEEVGFARKQRDGPADECLEYRGRAALQRRVRFRL
jgi:hypothetical protein